MIWLIWLYLKNHVTDVWQSKISNVSLKANYDRPTDGLTEKVTYWSMSFRSAQKNKKVVKKFQLENYLNGRGGG